MTKLWYYHLKFHMKYELAVFRLVCLHFISYLWLFFERLCVVCVQIEGVDYQCLTGYCYGQALVALYLLWLLFERLCVVCVQIEEAEYKQKLLGEIAKKELSHNERMVSLLIYLFSALALYKI